MRIAWNEPGTRRYEDGVDRGVLYPAVGDGVPWTGLLSISEDTAGGESESLYFDGTKYLDVVASENFQAGVTALSAPAEFAPCDGAKQLAPGLLATQQPRQTFGFSYRTLLGNDLKGLDLGYLLHLVYGCTAGPSGRQYQTLARTANPGSRTWTFSTVPPSATTYKPTAHFIVNSLNVSPAALSALENILYGTSTTAPRLPAQSEVIAILS